MSESNRCIQEMDTRPESADRFRNNDANGKEAFGRVSCTRSLVSPSSREPILVGRTDGAGVYTVVGWRTDLMEVK